MALPSSGAISLNDVNVELGLSGTAQISLNDAVVRTLFIRSSGSISMSDGYSKSNQFAFSISSNQTNANLATLATNAGWNGTSKVVATINSGVIISSNSTGTAALTISGFSGGLELTNNGTIVGMGGAGGNGGNYNNPGQGGSSGGTGGTALNTSAYMTLTNNGTIAGGGGGGGGGGASYYGPIEDEVAGGGGGGGRSSYAANSSGGAGGFATPYINYAVGGSAGTYSSAGTGGTGRTSKDQYGGYSNMSATSGGNGGNWGAAGSSGGGWYGSPWASSLWSPRTYGGAGGKAVQGNGYITWAATGSRYGSLA